MKKPINRVCSTCGEVGVRDEKHDAYACTKCDVWLESQCGAPDCEFCSKRPASPSEES